MKIEDLHENGKWCGYFNSFDDNARLYDGSYGAISMLVESGQLKINKI